MLKIGLAGEKGVLIIDKLPAVYVEPANALVIADIHLGYEEVMASTGVYLPRLQYRRAVRLLERLSNIRQGARLIIAGDIKHCFQKLTKQERIELAKLLKKAQELGFTEIIVIRGNHDNYAKTVLHPLGIDIIEDSVDLGNGVLVAHGHKRVKSDFELLIMGHEHPALQVAVSGGRAKFPLFLEMPLEDGSRVLVLPPAGVYQVGNVVSLRREGYLSPIIREKGEPERALPIILDEETGLTPLVSLGLLQKIMAESL